MAGELLAHVLLDIGRDYSSRQAEERALLRKEQEKLDEREYQKVLREERLKTEKELITFRNSEEGKQLEANLEMQGKAARKNASIQDEETLTRNAVDASGLSPEEVTKLSRKERLNLVEKATYEKSARALTNQQQTQDTLNQPKKQEAVDTVRAVSAQYDAVLLELAKLDNGSRILAEKDARAQQLVDAKYPPDPARAGKLKDIGLPPTATAMEIVSADLALSAQLTSDVKVMIQKDPKATAAMLKLDVLGKQLAEASRSASQLGANPYSDKYGAMPVAPKVEETVVTEKSDGTPKLPGGDKKPNAPAAPVVDNVFTQRAAIDNKGRVFDDQYVPAYFQSQKTDGQIIADAGSASPSWAGRAVAALPFGSAIRDHYVAADPVGSSLVDRDDAATTMAKMQQQRAAALAEAQRLAPLVAETPPAEASYWTQLRQSVGRDVLGRPEPGSEDAVAQMTAAQKVAWFRSHNLGANVSAAPVAEAPTSLRNPYWQVKQ